MAQPLVFTGFTPDTVRFLKDLKENNYKQWFEAHREVYENELLRPFKALVAALSPVMYNIDSQFELRPHKALSRIYRDIRFSKNKDPYKTCLWMNFQRTVTHWEFFPGFFMELNAENYLYGMGLYLPRRAVMDNFRDLIELEPENFGQMVQKSVLERGFSIEGEAYKRPLPNNLPANLQAWVNRKSIYVMKILPHNETLYSPALLQQIADDYTALKDLYLLMAEAADLSD
ncbi:MAG: DUF2461 domain-containing protein [Dysgonamonadaceae bacterium]|jgi:uncharacterized protein (TIGR02453 family)|nr:DUF2461 domain-containing protein [Dysgonamonadaceae bacterium]